MASKLTKMIANFETQIAAKLAVGGVTGFISSVLDKDNVTLPNGTYSMVADLGLSTEEHLVFDLDSSTKAITNIKSISRQGVETVGAVREHRVGAKLKITDFKNIKVITDILNGVSPLDGANPLIYDLEPTISDRKQVPHAGYVQDVLAGAFGTASDVVAGSIKGTHAQGTKPRAFSTLIREQNTPDMTLLVGAFKFDFLDQIISFAGGNSPAHINPGLGGDFGIQTNPSNGETITITINGTACVLTFVSTIGATPGNVLIAGSANATRANLVAFINAPSVTNANQVAFTGAQLTAIGLIGATDDLSLNAFIRAISSSVTTFAVSETLTGTGNAWTVNTTKHRIDLVVYETGTTSLKLRKGVEATSPVAPTPITGDIVLAQIYCRVGMTSTKDRDDATNGYIVAWYFPTVYRTDLVTSAILASAPIPAVSIVAENDMALGDAGCISTAGKARRSNWVGVGTLGSAVTNGTVSTAGVLLGVKDLDSTHKIQYGKDNAGINNLWWQLITINKLTGVPTLGAVTNLTKTIDNDALDCDCVVLSPTKVCFVYTSSTNVVKARIVDTITTSPVEGTEFTVAASNGNGASVNYIDNSNLIFCWHDSSTNYIKYYQCTISGTTITGGTSGNVYVDGTAKNTHKVRRYGTTNYFLFSFHNTSDSVVRGLIGLFDTGAKTFSVGSAVSTGEALQSAAIYYLGTESMSDNTIACGYLTSATVAKIRSAIRSGTTLSWGTSVSATFSSHSTVFTLSKLNNRVFCLNGVVGGSQMAIATFEAKKDESGFVAVITPVSLTAGNFQGAVVYISPGFALVLYCNSITPTAVPIAMTNNFGGYCGIFNADVVADASGLIQVAGATVVSGLTAGNKYVLDIGGLIAIADTDDPTKQTRAGRSLSASSLLVTI